MTNAHARRMHDSARARTWQTHGQDSKFPFKDVRGDWVNRPEDPASLFEQSLIRCLRKLGYTDEQVVEVTTQQEQRPRQQQPQRQSFYAVRSCRRWGDWR
jgi:hypothetical protein